VKSALLRLIQSLALCVGVAAVVAAAQPPAGQSPAAQPPASPTPAENIQPIRAKQVIGSKVSLTGDVGVGVVDDIVFDDGGSIEYVIVNKDNKLVTVPWSAVKFNFEKQLTTISITQQQYQVIPTYTVQTYPAFYDTTYRTKVYSWYGLTPGQLRRIERRR
jgi:PRC-barrel domain